MHTERVVRIVAGSLVLVSTVLAYYVSPWWSLLTLLVGANLLQSGFTRWCPLEELLKAKGMRSYSQEVDERESHSPPSLQNSPAASGSH